MDSTDTLIKLALEEDLGTGDVTTDAIFGSEAVSGRGEIIAKQELILSGLDVAKRVFLTVDSELQWQSDHQEGAVLKEGKTIAIVTGQTASLLKGERTALNFLQKLSGIATWTGQFVAKLKGSGVILRDTRKTLPGFRLLSKQAVLAGGGNNHRLGLWDQYLIKDNHIAAAGSITACVQKAQANNPKKLKIQVEVRTPEEAEEGVNAGATSLLLDNMSFDMVEAIAERWRNQVELEVSGNVSLQTVARWSQTGVHAISVGALTHSAPAADISMKIK